MSLLRHFNVLLLMGAILVCPYKCLGVMAAAETPVESVQKRSCCQHCSAANSPDTTPSSDNEPGRSTPEPDSDGCCDCLCDGAVVEASNKAALDWELSGTAAMPAVELTVQFPTPVAGPIRQHRPVFAFALDCARQMRLFLQSLLL